MTTVMMNAVLLDFRLLGVERMSAVLRFVCIFLWIDGVDESVIRLDILSCHVLALLISFLITFCTHFPIDLEYRKLIIFNKGHDR